MNCSCDADINNQRVRLDLLLIKGQVKIIEVENVLIEDDNTVIQQIKICIVQQLIEFDFNE